MKLTLPTLHTHTHSHVYGIHRSHVTMDLCIRSYVSPVDGSAASDIAVQARMGVTVFIARHVCKDALPRCCLVVFCQTSISPLLTPSLDVSNH